MGQSLGWYGPEDGAGLIGATLGAIIVLMIYGFVRRRA
ncbi:MAG TPA: GlsB/YeaQ/YmgE family stress response membrane protein [Tabrizicola sp.]